jgi:hypothetical protein
VIVATSTTLPVAVTLYFVAFYVFNLDYAKTSVKTVLFLQRYGVGILDRPTNRELVRKLGSASVLMESLSKSISVSDVSVPVVSGRPSEEADVDVACESGSASVEAPKANEGAPQSKLKKRSVRASGKKATKDFIFYR